MTIWTGQYFFSPWYPSMRGYRSQDIEDAAAHYNNKFLPLPKRGTPAGLETNLTVLINYLKYGFALLYNFTNKPLNSSSC